MLKYLDLWSVGSHNVEQEARRIHPWTTELSFCGQKYHLSAELSIRDYASHASSFPKPSGLLASRITPLLPSFFSFLLPFFLILFYSPFPLPFSHLLVLFFFPPSPPSSFPFLSSPWVEGFGGVSPSLT